MCYDISLGHRGEASALQVGIIEGPYEAGNEMGMIKHTSYEAVGAKYGKQAKAELPKRAAWSSSSPATVYTSAHWLIPSPKCQRYARP